MKSDIKFERMGLDIESAQTWFWLTALALAVSFAATACLAIFDRRRIANESVWAKPLKFEISLCLHFLTLALLTRELSENYSHNKTLLLTAIAAAGAAGFEMVYIVFRASRQEASHFNVKTRLARISYGLMAIGAIVITAAAGIVGAFIFADPRFGGGTGLRWASISGLSFGTLLTLVTAFRMGGAFSHHIGDEPQDAPRMPITGWSLSVGDGRPAHFAATHMMQIMPLSGLLCDHWLAATPATVVVAALTVVYLGLTLHLFMQANRGQPIFKGQPRPTAIM